MPDKQEINVRLQRPGFINRISDSLGQFIGALLVLGIGAVIAFKVIAELAAFLWPTLQWLIPLLVFLISVGWLFYKTINLNDEKAREFYTYKMNVALVRAAIILFVLFVDIKTVG